MRGGGVMTERAPASRNASRSAGSTWARIASFAYPIQASSEKTSSGASSRPPAPSVTITPASRAMSSVERS